MSPSIVRLPSTLLLLLPLLMPTTPLAFLHGARPAKGSTPLLSPAPSSCSRGDSLLMMSTAGSQKSKVEVVLGAYRDGALKVQVKKSEVTEEAIQSALAVASKESFKLVPVRVVDEGGASIGHTVVCDWKATYMSGGKPETVAKLKLRSGMPIPGVDIKNFKLELKEGQPEPYATFIKNVATGMGQMESKVFQVSFPSTMKSETLAGVEGKVTLLVRSIMRKEEDSRSVEEKRAQIEKELRDKAEKETEKAVLTAFRDELLKTCHVDTDKMVNSVSWAKFGERSLKDYQWQLIQEAIAAEEGLDFHAVGNFLKKSNEVVYV